MTMSVIMSISDKSSSLMSSSLKSSSLISALYYSLVRLLEKDLLDHLSKMSQHAASWRIQIKFLSD